MKFSSLIVVLALFGFITPSLAQEKSLEEMTGKIAKTCSADSTELGAVTEVSFEDSARVEDKAKPGAITIEDEE